MSAVEKLTDDDVLNFVQSTRKNIVTELTAKGIPVDNDERNTLLRTLEGMASTAQGNKRLRKEEESSAIEAQAKAMLSMLFKTNGRDPAKVDCTVTAERVFDLPAQLGSGAPISPGATEVGISSETFKDFSGKYGLND